MKIIWFCWFFKKKNEKALSCNSLIDLTVSAWIGRIFTTCTFCTFRTFLRGVCEYNSKCRETRVQSQKKKKKLKNSITIVDVVVVVRWVASLIHNLISKYLSKLFFFSNGRKKNPFKPIHSVVTSAYLNLVLLCFYYRTNFA